MDNATKGRADLREWEDSKPKNFFTADENLQHVLKRYMGETAYNKAVPTFETLGAQAATVMDEAAKIEDQASNRPKLERYNGIGERIEHIQFHPNHTSNGRMIWASGIMAMQGTAGRIVEQMGLYYLLGHNGEMGQLCSLACTAAVIKTLQVAADEPLRAKYLPHLLNPDYDHTMQGAEFLTEVQGGSDVGANAIRATDCGDGTWRINGEKWFCSNVNADLFVMTARASDAPGTRGLGLFLVPRKLDDGTINGFYIRRLKEKLGTLALASAELDFIDAVAYPIGPIEQGFKNAVELVLNTSRLLNAVVCSGLIRRAYLEASLYACHREAFGGKIAQYPMVQEAVADILSENYAATASSFYIAHLMDEIDMGRASESEKAAYRLLVNLNKYVTSVRANDMTHRAIEVLGGNGAIESFSVLPRLYRDTIVLESWEGAHNVLALQIMRDIARYQIHEGWVAEMRAALDSVVHPALHDSAQVVTKALQAVMIRLAKLAKGGDDVMQAHARKWVDSAAYVSQSALLLAEAQWEIEQGLMTLKPDAIIHYVNRHLLPDYDALEDGEYLARLKRLMRV